MLLQQSIKNLPKSYQKNFNKVINLFPELQDKKVRSEKVWEKELNKKLPLSLTFVKEQLVKLKWDTQVHLSWSMDTMQVSSKDGIEVLMINPLFLISITNSSLTKCLIHEKSHLDHCNTKKLLSNIKEDRLINNHINFKYIKGKKDWYSKACLALLFGNKLQKVNHEILIFTVF